MAVKSQQYFCLKYGERLIESLGTNVLVIVLSFYRATLCVSAVFAVAQCPSVCPSVTLVHSIQTAEDIVKFLCRPGSPIILVF